MSVVLLSNKEVDTIHDLLVREGVEYDPLKDDLLDHLCCMVETHMEKGVSFQHALSDAVAAFGPRGLRQTQEETVYQLTSKLRKMKEFTSISGLTGATFTIIGAFFKWWHWPGAGVSLVLGLSFIALFYLPGLLAVKLRESQGMTSRATYISGVVAAMVFTLSVLFKLMHWPFGNWLLGSSLAFMAFVFLPLYFIFSYRRTENKLMNTAFVLVLFALAVLVYRVVVNPSSREMDNSFYVMHQSLRVEVQQANQERISFIEGLEDSTRNDLQAVNEATETLISYIENMRVESIVLTQDVSPLDAASMNLRHMSWGVAASRLQHVLMDENADFNVIELKRKIADWKTALAASGMDEERLSAWLNMDNMWTLEYGEQSWEQAHFEHATIVSVVTYLDQLALEVNQRFLQFAYYKVG